MGVKSSLMGLLPFGAMVMVEFLDVGMTTLSKAAMSSGMNYFVLSTQMHLPLILFPSSFIFERKNRSPLTFIVLSKFFLLGLVGITTRQNCVLTGINYSSPTLSSALSNLIPVFTFLLLVVFRFFSFPILFFKRGFGSDSGEEIWTDMPMET